MSFPIDATLKDIMEEFPGDYAAAFGLPPNQPTAVLNVDISTISAATDVTLGVGEPLREIADFNYQSGCDPFVDYRVHLYNAAFAHHFHVGVRTILVLLRPKADHANLTGLLAYTAGDTEVQFKYELVRMWERPVEPFLHSGLGLLPLATLCAMPENLPLEQALAPVIAEIHRRLQAEATPADALKLMTAAFVLTGSRIERATLEHLYAGYTMLEDSSAFEIIMDKGVMQGQRKVLMRWGRNRFGAPDAATELAIHSIQDIDRLDRLIDATQTANSWQDLLATP